MGLGFRFILQTYSNQLLFRVSIVLIFVFFPGQTMCILPLMS